jgi:hypothetical protein
MSMLDEIFEPGKCIRCHAPQQRADERLEHPPKNAAFDD